MYIHNIDLHYHAGQERDKGVSLEKYLLHAKATGRLVLGLTDHLDIYLGLARKDKECPYTRSISGLIDYYNDVNKLKSSFPEIKLLFAPEIGSRIDLDRICSDVIRISDYFIFELPFSEESIKENTKQMVNRLSEIQAFRDRARKPVYIAHPFRTSINIRLVKRDIQPWITKLKPNYEMSFSNEELSVFFMFAIDQFAYACNRFEIPVEVNGSTHYGIRLFNLPAPLQMLWASYCKFRDTGVQLVPGSDLHRFGRFGHSVPFDCFHYLGLTVQDLAFLTDII